MHQENLDRALQQEFPDKAHLIHEMKANDPHFRRLLEQNHDLWTQIHNIQNDITPASDDALNTLEKQRLKILDEIAVILASAKAPTAS